MAISLPKKKLALNDVKEFDSFRTMLNIAREEAGETVALKYKKNGAVHDVTYNELCNRVDALGTAMMTLPDGLSRVAVIGEGGAQSICSILTVLCSEGTVVPIDRNLPFDFILGIIAHSECTSVLFDRSLASMFEEKAAELPFVKNLICFDLPPHEQKGVVLSYKALVEKGESLLANDCTDFTILAPKGERCCMILYKTGEIDSLKGVTFSQSALRDAVIGTLQQASPRKKCLSVLSYDKPSVLVDGLLCTLHLHKTVCIGEGAKNFLKNLQYHKPDYILLPPLYVESIWQKTVKTIEKQGRAETMEKLVKTSNTMRKIGIDRRKTFFSAIHEMFGGELETIHVTGAAIDPDAVRFFDDIGISVLSSYDIPECACSISANRTKLLDADSAGLLLPSVEIKIADPDEEGAGEICVRGDVLMTGYFKNDDATKKVRELSGWLHTGDIGKVNAQGQLYLTGRVNEGIVLKCGKAVNPSEIESYLCSLAGVKEATVFAGDAQKGAEIPLVAHIVLNEETVSSLTKSERTALIKEKIDALNRTLPPYKRVSKVRIEAPGKDA